jgi:hypothetical protein
VIGRSVDAGGTFSRVARDRLRHRPPSFFVGISGDEAALSPCVLAEAHMKAALALTVAAALGIPSAHAIPFVSAPSANRENIVRVWGGCGWGWHPVPGHWSYWGGWVPPHCAPNQYWGGGSPYGYGYGHGYGDGPRNWNGQNRHEDEDRD